MSKFKLLSFWLLLIIGTTSVFAQDYIRKEVDVPKVDSGAITIDGMMNEAEWSNAAHADLVTNSGYEIYADYYYRDGLTEPDFDALYGRMLWSKDTLYVFVHWDEFHNDSTNLYWNGKWTGDQLFVSLSNRIARNMQGWYDGNSYAAPDGPYHFWILGSDVTLNGGDTTYVPEEYRKCIDQSDSLQIFHASDIARWAAVIDTNTGVWDMEMAIYNPNVNAQSRIGFNIGGSAGSSYTDALYGDAYAYFTWQPNVADEPFTDPVGNGDPGQYNLANSNYWAILKFTPGSDDITRREVDVPGVQRANITVDGMMDESDWQSAADIGMITNSGYDVWTNYYYRDGLTEPDLDALDAKLLWSDNYLYVFVHWDEFHNDSTNLYWNGKWTGDQLFISLSNRLGMDMKGWYDGNSYAAPDGPYHYWVLGPEMTLNGGDTTYIPEEFRGSICYGDSQRVFFASDYAQWAAVIDTNTGVWDMEMKIYNPNVANQSCIGYNMGGSFGSSYTDALYGDAYAYWTWQPNVPNEPFTDPYGNGDPGYFNLANSEYWAVLNFGSPVTGIAPGDQAQQIPDRFSLYQNYPNPFNPSTTIKFDMPERSNVSLRVYNILGQLVTTLVNNQNFSAGTHSVNFDASRLASGIYLYKLEAGNVQISRKMLLVK